MRLGRDPANDLALLADPKIPRSHAELRDRDGQWILVDLGSSNGTRVNDRRVEQHPLRDGDRIQLGRTTIIFTTDDDPNPTETDTRALAKVPDLSERERQILALVALGLTDRQVGQRLFISPSTVRSHLDRIGKKTGTPTPGRAHTTGPRPRSRRLNPCVRDSARIRSKLGNLAHTCSGVLPLSGPLRIRQNHSHAIESGTWQLTRGAPTRRGGHTDGTPDPLARRDHGRLFRPCPGATREHPGREGTRVASIRCEPASTRASSTTTSGATSTRPTARCSPSRSDRRPVPTTTFVSTPRARCTPRSSATPRRTTAPPASRTSTTTIS